jgi:hypothetical protein
MSPIVLGFEPSLGEGLSISQRRIAVHAEKTSWTNLSIE